MSVKSKVAAAVSLHMVAWLAMLVVLTGIIFLGIGGYGLLVPRLGAGAAGLIVGAVLIGAVALAGLVGWAIAAPKAKPAPKPRSAPADRAPTAGAEGGFESKLAPLVGRRASAWTREHTGLALLGALSAGVAVSTSPALRRILYDAGRPIVTRKVYQFLERLIDDA